MKIEIRQPVKKINIFSLEVSSLDLDREVYIDEVRCPPWIEQVFLTGIDTLICGYLKDYQRYKWLYY